MSENTKGPWKMTDMDNRGWIGIYSGDCRTVADVVCQLPNETKANAALIAAAPDMYEALKGLVDVCPECDGKGYTIAPLREDKPGNDFAKPVPCVYCEQARAALSKAAG